MNVSIRFLILILFLATIGSTSAQQKNSSVVTISGRLVNTTDSSSKLVRIFFSNPVISNNRTVRLNADNEFSASGEMLFAQNMTVRYGDHFMNLYVQPGDSVYLTIDVALLGKPDFAWLKISGDHSEINTQICRLADLLAKVPMGKYDQPLPVGEMLATIKADVERGMALLQEYAQKEKLDPVVIRWARCDRRYAIWNYASDYGGLNRPASEIQASLKLMSDPFFDLYNPENFQSTTFPYLLDNYQSRLCLSDTEVALSLKSNQIRSAALKGIALLMKQPAGDCRDYMIYKYLAYLKNKTVGLLDSLPAAAAYFSRSLYYDQLKKLKIAPKSNIFPVKQISGISYLNTDGSVNNLSSVDITQYLATRYPGKLVYVDVYATWCGPCLAEMKFAPRLHKSFAGKPVVFVNLCLSSKLNDWKVLVKSRNIKGENYYLNEDATLAFMSNYRLIMYPSYLLVNPKGNIITTNASRPSDETKVNRQIGEILSQM